MSTHNPLDPSSPLTPSEIVLLNGDRFAKKAMIGNLPLLDGQTSVSAAQLGEAILATAFLSCEASGALRLETRQRKATFGLRKVRTLHALPGERAGTWPEVSLEGRLSQLARQSGGDPKKSQISRLVYTLLGEDSDSPWASVVELAKAGLAARGLLESRQEKKLKIFSTTHYSLPESTASLAAEIPVEPVRETLAQVESQRPEIWKPLVKNLKKAISDRTSQSDVDMDF